MRVNAGNGVIQQQYNLAISLYKGLNGESVNQTEGRQWLQKAALGGHNDARREWGQLQTSATVLIH
jgi:TPR repeat protein